MTIQTQTTNQQTTTQVATGQPQNTPTTPAVEDLVTRASGVSPEPQNNNQEPAVDILEDSGFDRNKWNETLSKLPPDQRQLLDGAYKSLQKGADSKFKKASELIKQAEGTRRRPTVQELVNDPAWLAEAQVYAQQLAATQAPQGSNLTEDEWSALTPTEKEEIRSIKQQNFTLQNQMGEFMRVQEDDRIKQRYKNYDPTLVNQIVDDVMNRRVTVTREHLWRAHDYEDAIKRAYQLGVQDKQLNIHEKQNGSTNTGGFNVVNTDEIPAKQPGQSSIDYFKQLAIRRLNQSRAATGKS